MFKERQERTHLHLSPLISPVYRILPGKANLDKVCATGLTLQGLARKEKRSGVQEGELIKTIVGVLMKVLKSIKWSALEKQWTLLKP